MEEDWVRRKSGRPASRGPVDGDGERRVGLDPDGRETRRQKEVEVGSEGQSRGRGDGNRAQGRGGGVEGQQTGRPGSRHWPRGAAHAHVVPWRERGWRVGARRGGGRGGATPARSRPDPRPRRGPRAQHPPRERGQKGREGGRDGRERGRKKGGGPSRGTRGRGGGREGRGARGEGTDGGGAPSSLSPPQTPFALSSPLWDRSDLGPKLPSSLPSSSFHLLFPPPSPLLAGPDPGTPGPSRPLGPGARLHSRSRGPIVPSLSPARRTTPSPVTRVPGRPPSPRPPLLLGAPTLAPRDSAGYGPRTHSVRRRSAPPAPSPPPLSTSGPSQPPAPSVLLPPLSEREEERGVGRAPRRGRRRRPAREPGVRLGPASDAPLAVLQLIRGPRPARPPRARSGVPAESESTTTTTMTAVRRRRGARARPASGGCGGVFHVGRSCWRPGGSEVKGKGRRGVKTRSSDRVVRVYSRARPLGKTSRAEMMTTGGRQWGAMIGRGEKRRV